MWSKIMNGSGTNAEVRLNSNLVGEKYFRSIVSWQQLNQTIAINIEETFFAHSEVGSLE